jgi:hypothetical protein
VINVNVTTRAHRDKGDPCLRKLCLMPVISDRKGGSLHLNEPGVVLELKSRDIVLFKSDSSTHFNLP